MSKDKGNKAISPKGRVGGTPYLWALLPFLLLLKYRILPFIEGLSLPFVEYSMTQGLKGSPKVGLDNFRQLFGSFRFSRILGNTIILKLEYILLCSIVALLLALILGSIRSKVLQRIFSAFFLLPYFIPTAVFAYLALYTMNHAGAFFLLSQEALASGEKFRLTYGILEAIKNLGIPTIIAIGAMNARREMDEGTGGFVHTKLLPSLKAIGVFALIQLSTLLTMDYELLSNFQSPMSYEVSDTIDTYVLRTGLMSMEFGPSAVAWLFRYIVQLVLSISIFYVLKIFPTGDLFPEARVKKDAKKKGRRSILAVVIGLLFLQVYLLVTTAPLAVSVMEVFKGEGGLDLTSPPKELLAGMPFYDSFIRYLFIVLAAVLINGLCTLLLAYPLTVKDLPGRNAYTIFLIFALNMGTGGIHEYLFFREKGMVNTLWPYMITGFFTITNVFILKAIYVGRYDYGAGSFKKYLLRAIKPLLGLAALQYAFMWNSFYPGQLVYMTGPDKFSPVMMFRNLTMGMAPEAYGPLGIEVMKLGAIISIPGIIVMIISLFFFGHEVFIGQVRKQ